MVCVLLGGCAAIMNIARSRDEAIGIACGMLGRGINVKEIGPLRAMREGNVIGPIEIRKLQTMRAHDRGDSPGAFLPAADGSESLLW